MSLLPDSGWLAALNLPTKVIAGVFLAACIVLGLDLYSILDLAAFGGLARPIVIILAILFGCLLFATLVALVAQPIIAKRKTSLLSERRRIRKEENEAERAKAREKAIEAIDHLSGWELHYVEDALRDESPSFYTHVNSPPVAQLIAKNLVYSPGGQHHREHFPFSFHDFVWEALQERKKELIEKSEEFQRREEAKRRSGRRR